MTWLFSKKAPTETQRNPISDEQFTDGAEAIVREGVQNSLDAWKKSESVNDGPLRIRVFVSGSTNTPSYDDVKHIFDAEFISHASSKEAGLNNTPTEEDPCPYLVFEDFQTTGLVGDIKMHESPPPETEWSNPFYCFVRGDALQDKKTGEMGSWGVGKTVFPASSRFNATLFKTVREDDSKAFCMGRGIFKYHHAEGREGLFRPDTWLCDEKAIDDGEKFAMPIEDSGSLFAPFNISRENEHGLSIIIPYINEEDFKFQDLLVAFIENWAFAIIKGNLVVTIETEERTQLLDKDTISSCVELVENEAERENLSSLISIASDYVSTLPEECCFKLDDLFDQELQQYKNHNGRSCAPRWVGDNKQEWISNPQADKMRAALNEHGLLKVDVPLWIERVKPSGGSEKGWMRKAIFTVFFRKENQQRNIRPFPYRESLLVKGDRARRKPKEVLGHSSVIWVGETTDGNACPLAEMLRDSEDPSHTNWKSTTKKFKGKYGWCAKAKINFVRNSAHYIMSRMVTDEAPDWNLMASLFGAPVATNRDDPPVPPPPLPPPLPPGPKTHTILTGKGKFVVTAAEVEVRNIKSLKIRAAYDTNGNQFKKYDPYDFKFYEDIDIEVEGCDVISRGDNWLEINPTAEDFRVEVSKFHMQRDVLAEVVAELCEGAQDA